VRQRVSGCGGRRCGAFDDTFGERPFDLCGVVGAQHLRHGVGDLAGVRLVQVPGLLLGAGFATEVVVTPEDGLVTRARPDFFLRLSPGRGILAEVERGGAVTNNHDLKDIWKAHIAPDAQHLFLIVPNSNFSADGSPREKPFARVQSRAASFFGDPRREVDIVSLHVFGYGRSG
jgi:hypothetical protein